MNKYTFKESGFVDYYTVHLRNTYSESKYVHEGFALFLCEV
jgi:hypothetical protein